MDEIVILTFSTQGEIKVCAPNTLSRDQILEQAWKKRNTRYNFTNGEEFDSWAPGEPCANMPTMRTHYLLFPLPPIG